jgi:enamine deaminase RidA (YjgF/YER057c/UK114 family)
MTITPIHSREPKPEYRMPFVPVFVVESSRLLFLAGVGPIPPYHTHPHVPAEEAVWMAGGIREQTERTFEHIRELLACGRGGCRQLGQADDLSAQCGRPRHRERGLSRGFAGRPPPPRTVVQAVLNHENMLIEIDAIAAF